MEKFRTNLVETINVSGLPVGEIYYVLKDVFRDVQDAYKEYVEKQAQAEQEAMLKTDETPEVSDSDIVEKVD